MLPDLIGTDEAAKILQVSHRTAKRLARLGVLPTTVKAPGKTGAYLFDRADIERVAAERAEAAS